LDSLELDRHLCIESSPERHAPIDSTNLICSCRRAVLQLQANYTNWSLRLRKTENFKLTHPPPPSLAGSRRENIDNFLTSTSVPCTCAPSFCLNDVTRSFPHKSLCRYYWICHLFYLGSSTKMIPVFSSTKQPTHQGCQMVCFQTKKSKFG
jgi:hypothetical protein